MIRLVCVCDKIGLTSQNVIDLIVCNELHALTGQIEHAQTHSSDIRVRIISLRMNTLCDASGDLLGMFAERRKRLRFRSRLAAAIVGRLDNWLVDLAEVFRDLWESSKGFSDWAENGNLELGVLTTRFGRCRSIPASYKAEMISQIRSDSVLEHRHVAGFVQGLLRSSTPGRFRRFLARRKKKSKAKRAARQQARAAKSQLKTSHPDSSNFARRLVRWDRFNYWKHCQSTALLEHRYSLAMDGTEASFKKIMNATMCFPMKELCLWLPPMDTWVYLTIHFVYL